MKKEVTPMPHIPPGVITQRKDFSDRVIYEFSHLTLGPLGRLCILMLGNQMQISIDIPPGEVSDPQWVQRFEMLSMVANACLELLPGKKPPLLNVEEVKTKIRLYRAFLRTENSSAMMQFVRGLSHEDEVLLLSCIEHVSLTYQSDLAYDLQQKIADFQEFRNAGSPAGLREEENW